MNINKLGIIIRREYISRAKKKSFLLSTLLTPLFIVAVTIIPVLITAWDSDDDEQKVYAVIDESEKMGDRLISLNSEKYFVADLSEIDSLKNQIQDGSLNGLIILNDQVFAGTSDPDFIYKTGGLDISRDIRRDINKVWLEAHLDEEKLSPEIQELVRSRVSLNTIKLTEEGTTKEENGLASFGLAYVMAFTIYMALFGYGAIIMRSVLEEKTSRIVEIMISSVKPIELMIGKVLGVGLLGLTQLVSWIVMYSGITFLAAPLYLMFAGKQMANMPPEATQAAQEVPFSLPELEISYMILFLVFYLLGYFMYSSLFAAVGSAADAETDVQQFMLPVMIFIIMPMIFLAKVATDPNSSFAIFTSLFPLFSPILMVTRMGVTSVPWWEIALSIVLMLAMTFLLLWVAGKIYRVGILMYGKKPSYKELAKWISYK